MAAVADVADVADRTMTAMPTPEPSDDLPDSHSLRRWPVGDASGTLVVLGDGTNEVEPTAFAAAAAASGLDCLWPTAAECWWVDVDEPADDVPCASRSWLCHVAETATGPCVLVGIGTGGQAAAAVAFDRPDLFVAVAAIAPASDLHQWYDRDRSLQAAFVSAEQARQHEAPLRLNPLHRPRGIWVGCDPRDRPCFPSAVRLATKLSSSGIPVESDLTTEIGDSRMEYAAARAGRIVQFLKDAAERVALPIL